MKKKSLIPLLSLSLFHPLLAHAVAVSILPPAESRFITIEDRDNIYIGALSNLAGITGSGRLTTHPDHAGLSYLSDGQDRTIPSLSLGFSYNIEIWEDNPAVSSPYLGVHCWKHQSNCVSSVFDPSNTVIRDNGFRLFSRDRDSRLINPRLSQGYMNYLSKLPVGNKFKTNINYCWSMSFLGGAPCTTNSDLAADRNRWEKKSVTFIKEGHLRLHNSPVTVDLMISNSGDFWVLPGSRDCESQLIAGKIGVVCRFLTYDLTLASSINMDMLSLTPNIKDSRLTYLNQDDFKISTDKNTWYNQGNRMSFRQLKNSDSIYIFMSKEVIKSISKIPPPRKLTNMFSLIVGNQLHPGSGFYEINGTTDVNFTSRQMTVSIREKNGLTDPIKSGTVGRDKIEFEYVITESATIPSESLEVSIQQDIGTPYKKDCTFYPPNNVKPEMAVVIPARILFSNRIGAFKNSFAHIYCDGSPIDLRAHGISETQSPLPWMESEGIAGAARFYDISLLFNLRPHSVSQTIGGEAWEGEVYQSGTIRVKSLWK